MKTTSKKRLTIAKTQTKFSVEKLTTNWLNKYKNNHIELINMENLFETRPDFTCNHDMRRCTVNGKEMFCTDERIKDEDVPKDLYKAEVRGNDLDYTKWETIEPVVRVNHTATLISDEPFKFESHYDINGRIDPYTQVEDYEIEYDPDLDF